MFCPSHFDQFYIINYEWWGRFWKLCLVLKIITLPMVHRCKKCGDIKSALWWQSWNWKCEKWQPFRFVLSPPPTDATFKMTLHFFHLRNVGQQGLFLNFEKMVYIHSQNNVSPRFFICKLWKLRSNFFGQCS